MFLLIFYPLSLIWGSVLLSLRSPKGGRCSISGGLSCFLYFCFVYPLLMKRRYTLSTLKLNIFCTSLFFRLCTGHFTSSMALRSCELFAAFLWISLSVSNKINYGMCSKCIRSHTEKRLIYSSNFVLVSVCLSVRLSVSVSIHTSLWRDCSNSLHLSGFIHIYLQWYHILSLSPA